MKLSFTPAQFLTPSPVSGLFLIQLVYKLYPGATSLLLLGTVQSRLFQFLLSLTCPKQSHSYKQHIKAHLQEGEGGRDKKVLSHR